MGHEAHIGISSVEVKNKKYEPIDSTDIDTLKAYVDGLRDILGSAEVLQQKAFLRNFIKSIDVSRSDVAIHYTSPMPIEE
jgi:hypothetical protein